VQHLGSEYGVILNDPKLRGGLIAEAERSQQRPADKPRASMRLRLRLAHTLRALAIRIEPRFPKGSEAGSSQPVFAE